MSQERLVVCHNTDGKPCANITEAASLQLAEAGKGRIIRSRAGRIVRLVLSESAPERHAVGWRGGSQTIVRAPIRDANGTAVTPPFFQHKELVYSTSTPQG